MLSIKDLHVHYGGIHAIKGISLEVPRGKVVTLIGANGAGKSSTLRAIAGIVKKSSGSIELEGREISGLAPEDIVKSGIMMAPEGRKILPHLTVLENLMLGAFSRNDPGGIDRDLAWVYELFPRLKERAWQKGGTLSGGEQQMLSIGRALMSKPRLLLLDEPSLGLAPIIIRDIFKELKRINEEGVTILLVEQNARQALLLSHRGYVMQTGRILMEGPASELLKNPDVEAAYLGTSRK